MPPRNRPYFHLRVHELHKTFDDKRGDSIALGAILAELTHRKGLTAARLRLAIERRIDELSQSSDGSSAPPGTASDPLDRRSGEANGQSSPVGGIQEPRANSGSEAARTLRTVMPAESVPTFSKVGGEDRGSALGCLVLATILLAIMWYSSNPKGTGRGGGTSNARHAPRTLGVCTGSPDCRVCTTCSSCAFCGRGRKCGVCAGR